jgi:hypothetical protein
MLTLAAKGAVQQLAVIFAFAFRVVGHSTASLITFDFAHY